MHDFSDFAADSAKAIAREEGNRMQAEMVQDLEVLVERWAAELSNRVVVRLESAGLVSEITIRVEWDPPTPTFIVVGNTYIGGDTGV